MYASGERIHRVLLHSRVIDADFRIGDAAAVPGLGIRFVLYHAVAFRWSSRHRGKQVAGNMRARIGQASEPQVGFLVSSSTAHIVTGTTILFATFVRRYRYEPSLFVSTFVSS